MIIECDLLDSTVDETEFMISDAGIKKLNIVESLRRPLADHEIRQSSPKSDDCSEEYQSLIVAETRRDTYSKDAFDDEDQDIDRDDDSDIDTDEVEESFKHYLR